MPFNVRIGSVEIPVGLGLIASALFTIALANLLTKQVATISGIIMTAAFSTLFFVSERITQRRQKAERHGLDQFNLQPQHSIDPDSVEIRPGGVLCPVRDYNNLEHLRHALDVTHTGERDLVVMTVHLLRGPNSGHRDLNENKVFTDYEQTLFTRVVAVAEKAGKHVDLIVVPSPQPIQAIVQTAAQLVSAQIIVGGSPVMSPREQALRFGEAWERLPHKPRHQVLLLVAESATTHHEFTLGAHPPTLDPRDVNLIHDLWIGFKNELPHMSVRHRDIVTLAVQRLEKELSGAERDAILAQMASLKRSELSEATEPQEPPPSETPVGP